MEGIQSDVAVKFMIGSGITGIKAFSGQGGAK